jgi:hypothetical protein
MSLLPEERAFLDAFWGAGWTMPQAQKALENLLEWKRKKVIEECINVIDDMHAETTKGDRVLDAAFAALRRLAAPELPRGDT